jgi:hypothetical protein
VVFDNRWGFPKGFADLLLSSLVTGSCDSKRELYTTDSEYAFKVKRPVIVNAMSAYASQTLWRGLLGVTSVRGRAKQEVAEEGLRAHFKTWYDRCGVSVKRTVFYVGFLQFGSALVSLRYPNVGFEMRS